MFCTAIDLLHCHVHVAVVLSEAASTGLRSILASVRSLQSSLDALIAARVPTNVDRASITYLLIMNKVQQFCIIGSVVSKPVSFSLSMFTVGRCDDVIFGNT